MAGARASTQLGDWQGPKLQDFRSVSKQRGGKALEEKQDKDRTTGSEQGPREVGGMDTHGGNKQAPYWEAGVRKAETRGEQGRQRQHGELRPSLHRSTLEALEKNTGQNYIPRDPKTVGWGEKERKNKER